MALATLIQPALAPFWIRFDLVHYENIAIVDWHVQLELARGDDPTFASKLSEFTKDTTAAQAGFFYKDTQLNATDGNLLAFPSTGIRTDKAQRDDDFTVARVYYYAVLDAQLARLALWEQALVRARQSPDDGVSWGDWSAWTIVPGMEAQH